MGEQMFTDAQLRKAYEKHYGHPTKIADELKVSRWAVHLRLRDLDLKPLGQEARRVEQEAYASKLKNQLDKVGGDVDRLAKKRKMNPASLRQLLRKHYPGIKFKKKPVGHHKLRAKFLSLYEKYNGNLCQLAENEGISRITAFRWAREEGLKGKGRSRAGRKV